VEEDTAVVAEEVATIEAVVAISTAEVETLEVVDEAVDAVAVDAVVAAEVEEEEERYLKLTQL